MIEHDQNYTSSVVSVLFHKTGGREGAIIQGEVLILNFGQQEGRFFEGVANSRGGA